ncbi:NACHT domain-containing protein [Stigmatella sp. ncwal1]|uniref:NACHT domain-containing protein n=1 Tax=Stigmatella ashevillensis TaxID=2995309 RepID=A0ABT5D667_9BACT|nr:NACHT domain-containing protein [Stigmatella ashevillena]MDC0709152.1 NACHT domain-containing protein [Stigmatella ashevillena]
MVGEEKEYLPETQGRQPQLRRALILTALSEEYKAVRVFLGEVEEVVHGEGTVYEKGEFASPVGDWEIILGITGKYSWSAAVETERAIRFWQPEVALFVGIAGGIKDVRIGDVVAADKAYAFEAGKAKQEFEPRPETERSSYALVQRAKKVALNPNWLSRLGDSLPTSSAQALVGPIATGSQVVAETVSDIYAFLQATYGDALAVEMEGSGFLAAARSNMNVHAMVIRGISDLIDGKREADAGGSHELASRHAAAFAFELLTQFQKPSVDARNEDEPTVSEPIGSFRDSFQEKTRQLLSWPQLLPGERWIERPELESLLHRIESESSSTTIVLGQPGSGKSALLARLGTRLAGREDVVLLALKADRLPTSLGTPETLQKWLELSRPLHEILNQLSQVRKVVLLVDQLDALSDLVDLSTGRLNVLMGLLQRVAETPNLHIVASCRSFEFRHDVRLRDYQANVIQLELPAWNLVEPVLREAGVDSAIWSKHAREVLRTPQHLKIFLEHFKNSHTPFHSYHAMLEELWQQCVLDSRKPGLDELVSAVATEMTDTEQLTLPAARFDKQRDKVQQLLVADILFQDGTRIGFTHQTLFEFARARLIISGQEHLNEFVLPRQATLSIRPKLWSCLMYLRDVGGRLYRDEFQRLWSAPKLRPHLRALMIDFLGQLDAPTADEEAWLRSMLQDNEWRRRTLSAVATSPGWFEWLARLQLPYFMVTDLEQAQAVLPVLIHGWRLNREKVLELIEDCWVEPPEKHGLALKAFQQLDVWNERAVRPVVRILRESPIAANVASNLASLVSAHAPKLAPQIVAAALERQVQDISVEKKTESEVLHACEQMLVSSRDWYAAADIAAAAPAEYLDAVWPWFVRLLERFVEEPHSFVTGYPRSRLSLLVIDEEEIQATLFSSIREAVFSTAEHESARFLKFVHEWDRSQVLDVHRMLAQGMCHMAEANPQETLEYLLADPRRLIIGGYPDPLADSRALIRMLAPQLTQEDLLRLEVAIKQWRYYSGNIPPASGPDPLWRLKNEREHRLHLLLAIPEETRSARTRKFVQSEELALGELREPEPEIPRLVAIVSPMSSEQMEKAHDEDILGLFAELTDETEWRHPRRRLLGGSVEAAREFAAFAVKHPDRAIGRMRRFKPGHQERPVAYALDELARHKHDPAELAQWVFEFDARGFHSDDFRASAAHVLEKAADKLQGLDDSLLSLLASWLKEAETAPSSEERWDGDLSPSPRPTPLLGRWTMGGRVPDGNFPILEAILKGYLSRNPPLVEQAFSVLELHLKRQERTDVWEALWAYLIRLFPQVGFERAWKFLSELFTRQPRVFSSRGGVYLLERVRWKAPPELLQPWMESLRTTGWKVGNQAFGELVALTATMNSQAWAKQEVEKILTGEDIADADLGQLRLGLAFSSSLLWREPGWRRKVTDLQVRLIPVADDDVAVAIMDTFGGVDALLDDLETRRLLGTIVKHPKVLHGGPQALVERLGDLLSCDPELIVQVCQAVVDQIPLQPKMAIPLEELVNLALTLERQERIRPKGLELFERMCQVDILSFGAEEALRESDGRLGRHESPPLRRRPAPRRRRK